jgi:hypothetical protein
MCGPPGVPSASLSLRISPDVEDEGGRGEREERESAVGHGGLDGADAGGGGVFAGFDVVVEEVWGAEYVSVCEAQDG